jgi:hypothetical protein
MVQLKMRSQAKSVREISNYQGRAAHEGTMRKIQKMMVPPQLSPRNPQQLPHHLIDARSGKIQMMTMI